MESITLGLVIVAVLLHLYQIKSKTASTGQFGTPVFVDTSALMDGRIVTAAQTGFISERIIIPQSVIAELQMLADKADAEKRSRARRGLDAVRELQELSTVRVQVLNDGSIERDGVDDRLIELARRYKGRLCTIDFNLNKVAKIHGIFVLNLNELAQSMRMAFLPGETITIELTQKGQDQHQGVGYLADGTMVVVENAHDKIGSKVEVEFIRSLQTAAGRMMFAKPVGLPTVSGKKPNRYAKKVATHGKPKSKEDDLIHLVNNQ